MNKSILTISAWKLFLAFGAGMIIANGIATLVATYFNWSREYGPYPTLKYGLMTMILWTYPYLVGRALSQRSLPGADSSSHTRVLLIFLLAIINNTLSVYLTETFGVSGLVVLITVLVNIFCLVGVPAFPARILRSAELNRSARLVECWLGIIQFMLWPFFVWWLQPALASLDDGSKLTRETLPASQLRKPRS